MRQNVESCFAADDFPLKCDISRWHPSSTYNTMLGNTNSDFCAIFSEYVTWGRRMAKLDIFVLVYRQLWRKDSLLKRVRMRMALTIPHGSNLILWTCHSSHSIVQALTHGHRISFLEKWGRILGWLLLLFRREWISSFKDINVKVRYRQIQLTHAILLKKDIY